MTLTPVPLHWPAGALCDGSDPVHLSVERAGWKFAGLRVLSLQAGVTRSIETGDCEIFVLPLRGSCDVAAGTEEYRLQGRESVFSRVSDFAYVGRDATVALYSQDGALVALPLARTAERLPAQYVPADAVPIEVRGAGPATRQVTNFGVPGVFDGADRLIACELITPAGNWSSYPPHRHDSTCPVANEEIYYFRVAAAAAKSPADSGFGLYRAVCDDTDLAIQVRDGDICLVPHGYHGPCCAPPGYELYYLNVLAGPGKRRSMAFCDDPLYAWVRDQWQHETTDPRCPLTSATGRLDGRRQSDP